jgi:hypothetical protein
MRHCQLLHLPAVGAAPLAHAGAALPLHDGRAQPGSEGDRMPGLAAVAGHHQLDARRARAPGLHHGLHVPGLQQRLVAEHDQHRVQFVGRAAKPQRKDEPGPSSGAGLRTQASEAPPATPAARAAASTACRRSAWCPSTTTMASAPHCRSRRIWRSSKGSPSRVSRLLGRQPMRRPAPAAMTTAPTFMFVARSRPARRRWA